MSNRVLTVILAALALTAFAALLQAQSACRGECDLFFQRCKRGCVDAQNFDDCVGDCRNLYEQCLTTCQ